MKRLLPLLLLLVGACSPLYVLRAGWEEAKILSRRQPIRELVADPSTPEARRDKLALVLQARDFAARELRLDAGDSYTTFSEVDSDTLALVLSAAHRDRFEAYTWWFPIVGRVPYKGYFSERRAREAMRDLEAEGFDTYLRPTAAFSTLGWFNDPLLSTLLRADTVSLANTVIHELLHNTIYVSGEAQFNESFANFVGARGAIQFFCGRDGEDSPSCERARASWRDELLFGRFIDDLATELEALYARPDLSSEQKIQAREAVFETALGEFARDIRPRLQVATFASFERAPLNNATLLARRLYYHRLDLFEQVFQRTGGDLPRTIARIVRAAERADDPYAAVERLPMAVNRPPPQARSAPSAR